MFQWNHALAGKQSHPFLSTVAGFNLNLQDAEGTYKTYLGGGALPPDDFTNPADPRVQEELTDRFVGERLGATHQTPLPSSSLVGISP